MNEAQTFEPTQKERNYTLSNRYRRSRNLSRQNFDREEKIEIKGQKVKIVDFIQEEESNDIYYNLEKYGCLDKLTLNKEQLYADFNEYISLRDIQDKIVKADNMWGNLPLDIREKFNNDKNLFANTGMEWLKDEIQKEIKLIQPGKQPTNKPGKQPTNQEEKDK